MSCAAGPDLSESGLVLALDGGNNKSHSSNRFISYGSGLITQGISFQVNGEGTFQRVAAGTVIGGYVVKTTDVVYSYALGSNGCHYHGNSAPIPAGSYATFSFDYLVTGATTYPITDFLANFENYGGGALGGSVATANSLQNVWQRRTFTSGPTFSAGTQAMFLYPGSCGGRLADSGTIYFRNPKVEWTNVDTGDGNFSSMPNVTTWYDMSGNGNNGTLTNTPYYIMGSNNINNYLQFDGVDDKVVISSSSSFEFGTGNLTVSGWGYVTSHINYRILASTRPGNGGYANAWHIGTDANGTILLYSNAFNLQSASNAVPVNQWFYWTFTRDTGIGKLFVNTIVVASGSVTNNYTLTQIGIGDFPISGAEPWAGRIAQTQIYNRALTAAEIQQNFIATRSRFSI